MLFQAAWDVPRPDTPLCWEGLKGAEQVNHSPPDGVARVHIDQQPYILQSHTHGPAEFARKPDECRGEWPKEELA